ncbi:DUF6221 family protein [Streptomyces nigra]|uniref:DUF6221 family protein n=1 Tax=Streptomyces nigra TaxID=1827580 RepID=UPI0037D6E081
MDDLVRWLGEQLDEDERIARAAGNDRVAPTPWRGESWDDAVLDGDGLVDANGDGIALVKGERVRAHILQHDPARVLREIDAKRRTLVRCEEAMLTASPMLVHFAKQTAWEMAQPCADRPGYKESWRP